MDDGSSYQALCSLVYKKTSQPSSWFLSPLVVFFVLTSSFLLDINTSAFAADKGVNGNIFSILVSLLARLWFEMTRLESFRNNINSFYKICLHDSNLYRRVDRRFFYILLLTEELKPVICWNLYRKSENGWKYSFYSVATG